MRSVLSHLPASPEPPPGEQRRPVAGPPGGPPAHQPATRGAPPPAHQAVVCVQAPALALSGPDGQLRAQGLDGFYQDGVRTLARLEVRVGGAEPLPLQGVSATAAEARFTGALRVPGEAEPDPGIMVERLRHASGRERITVRNSGARPARLPFEIAVGTDLGTLAAVSAGERGPDLPPRVHAAGLRWSAPARGVAASVTARPTPHSVLASAGLLRWDLELQPGARWTVELFTGLEQSTEPAVRGRGTAPAPWAVPDVRCDDARLPALITRALDDLGGLLLTDAHRAGDLYPASGAPWRLGLVPVDALWTARLLLPLGTGLARGTLSALARRLRPVPSGIGAALPGPLRQAGPGLPPSCTGAEATLLLVTVLAEAWRWGLPEAETEALLPAAESALAWLREQTGAAREGDGSSAPFLTEPQSGGVASAAAQAYAHRAALHGAELLEAFGRPGAERWRAWAADLREAFHERFWIDDLGGGWPALALLPGGRPVSAPGSALAHLLDTGLSAGGEQLPGLLERDRHRTLARRLAGPDLESGWGLRTLTTKSPRFNPLGHRAGAVRVHETVLAAAGMAEAGLEREAESLMRGLLDASAAFGGVLAEMYGGEQRFPSAPGPLPHPAACRPAAVASAAGIHLAAAVLAGVRPDVPAGRVAVRPMSTAPLGELELAGLRVAGRPFSARVSRIGVAVVEEAPDGLQLGAG